MNEIEKYLLDTPLPEPPDKVKNKIINAAMEEWFEDALPTYEEELPDYLKEKVLAPAKEEWLRKDTSMVKYLIALAATIIICLVLNSIEKSTYNNLDIQGEIKSSSKAIDYFNKIKNFK